MLRGNLNDLLAFLAVGKERSFTKATAKLGVSQSALSHTIRGLEGRLGLRLLTHTTRSVSPTEAGERLLHAIGPRFEEIETELASLSELREKPAGTIRITATDYAVETILWPKLARFLQRYPDVKVETIIEYGLTEIVAERFDAGVRIGEQVAKDTIAVRIGPDMRIAVVGVPSYFNARSGPQRPQDLIWSQLHQFAPAHAWRIVRLGIRERRPRAEGACRRPTRLQRHIPDAQCGARRVRLGLCARGRGATASGEAPSQAGARGLVPAVFRLPPLLSESAPSYARLRLAGRSTPLPSG
jgi:DNA-binding transcriptional LysR family regulator